MNTSSILSGALVAALMLGRAVGDIVVPGANGTDGVLNITTNTVIDLSQAVTAVWDSDNSANAGKGVYDASKWAVVFKYSSVTIRSNATVTFRNHASRAPVVWLVSGDVVIEGGVTLDGQNSQNAPIHAEPGPGGFRAGQGNYGAGIGSGSGFGLGGGRAGERANYGSIPGTRPAYGNPSVLQLIGGSGGGGSGLADPSNKGGGAGGGAIVIAAAKTIQIDGRISADGGMGSPRNYLYSANQAGAGSGGAIRLICNSLMGRGLVRALPGQTQDGAEGSGGFGRLRVERVDAISPIPSVVSFSPDPSVVTLPRGSEAIIWPPSEAPEVRITSIGGGAVSLDPRAGFGAFGPDVALPITNKTFVTVETKNVEPQSQVIVRVTPRANANFLEANASIVSSTNSAIQWQAGVDVNVGYSAVQVRVVRP
jgi:hypothetical protein